MRNGKDSMIGGGSGGGGGSTPGATGSGGGGGGQPFSVDSGADHQELTASSSMVEDLAVALDRLRRIEGERQLYLMLEELLDRSRKVLVQHKVVPPQRETAEMESLRAQLKRSESARAANHAYAVHYSDALQKIANLDGAEDLQDAQGLARDALRTIFGAQDETKAQA